MSSTFDGYYPGWYGPPCVCVFGSVYAVYVYETPFHSGFTEVS